MAGILCLILALSVIGSVRADDEKTYPIMHPDQETLLKWIEDYNAAPLAHIDLEKQQIPSPQGSFSLLSHLEYTASERNQGSCSNCWAWAGTGCLGIALNVEHGRKVRLSVQYINSCESDVIGKVCCAGGNLSEFADFYTITGKCIPWSNTNADWQDVGAACAADHCASIAETPSYPITSIGDETIPTLPSDGVTDQDTAIANIKSVLNQNKAVYFAFLLPDAAAWTNFYAFWDDDPVAVLYDIDKYNGDVYAAGGGAHAVLCVGYDDDDADPANHYWIMLNSWGTETDRPNGLFRITMDMDYDCVNLPYYSFYWQSLDVTFYGGGGTGSGGGGSHGCFIATSAYNRCTDSHGLKSRISTDLKKIEILQKFRDERLLTNPSGRAFVSCYERISPPIARYIEDKEPLKAIVRFYLKPVVWLAEKVTSNPSETETLVN